MTTYTPVPKVGTTFYECDTCKALIDGTDVSLETHSSWHENLQRAINILAVLTEYAADDDMRVSNARDVRQLREITPSL